MLDLHKHAAKRFSTITVNVLYIHLQTYFQILYIFFLQSESVSKTMSLVNVIPHVIPFHFLDKFPRQAANNDLNFPTLFVELGSYLAVSVDIFQHLYVRFINHLLPECLADFFFFFLLFLRVTHDASGSLRLVGLSKPLVALAKFIVKPLGRLMLPTCTHYG